MLNGIALFPLVTGIKQIYSNPHRKCFFHRFYLLMNIFVLLTAFIIVSTLPDGTKWVGDSKRMKRFAEY